MHTPTPATSWSITQALTVAYTAFIQRFGADLLHASFDALTKEPEHILAEHQVLAAELGPYLSHALNGRGAGHVVWLGNARADAAQARLLLHMGVRWWHARDSLLACPAGTRVPCVYAEGLSEHVSLQLLSQMLHRGAAPHTTHG